MFKVLVYQFQKIFTNILHASLQKVGLNHIIFLFLLFFFTVLLIVFINIIKYIFFLVSKLFPKTAIFKDILIYLTTLLEYFLVGG